MTVKSIDVDCFKERCSYRCKIYLLVLMNIKIYIVEIKNVFINFELRTSILGTSNVSPCNFEVF